MPYRNRISRIGSESRRTRVHAASNVTGTEGLAATLGCNRRTRTASGSDVGQPGRRVNVLPSGGRVSARGPVRLRWRGTTGPNRWVQEERQSHDEFGWLGSTAGSPPVRTERRFVARRSALAGRPGAAGIGLRPPVPGAQSSPAASYQQQPSWSRTNPPTAKFPSYSPPPGGGGPGAPIAPPYRNGPASAVPAAYGGAKPPVGQPEYQARGNQPPGPPPGPPGSGGPGGSGDEPRRRRGGVLAARIIALCVAAARADRRRCGLRVHRRPAGQQRHLDLRRLTPATGGVIFVRGMTILLVGSDARTDADGNPLSDGGTPQVATEDDGGGINTDTIMLVHVPKGGGKATAVSIPRDTWIGPSGDEPGSSAPTRTVPRATYEANKINSYYATAKAYTEEHLVKQGVTDPAQIERESNEAGRTMLIRVIQAFTGTARSTTTPR